MRSVYFRLFVVILLMNLAMSSPIDGEQRSQPTPLRRCRYYPYDDCENMTINREKPNTGIRAFSNWICSVLGC
uniref:Uncharacterized protein n=1 Tax=Plectus sambesii TaxID=2011161 RepID=A0A914UYE6_9BILA